MFSSSLHLPDNHANSLDLDEYGQTLSTVLDKEDLDQASMYILRKFVRETQPSVRELDAMLKHLESKHDKLRTKKAKDLNLRKARFLHKMKNERSDTNHYPPVFLKKANKKRGNSKKRKAWIESVQEARRTLVLPDGSRPNLDQQFVHLRKDRPDHYEGTYEEWVGYFLHRHATRIYQERTGGENTMEFESK